MDYHPSFAYTIKANIEGINQPDLFYQSSNVTDTYTTYTKTGSTVSVKEEVGEDSFKQSNVASQSGSIPKVATIKNPKGKQQKSPSGKSDIQKLAEMFGSTISVKQREGVRRVVARGREDDVAARVLVPAGDVVDLVVDHEPGVRRASVFCYFGPCVVRSGEWRVASTASGAWRRRRC